MKTAITNSKLKTIKKGGKDFSGWVSVNFKRSCCNKWNETHVLSTDVEVFSLLKTH